MANGSDSVTKELGYIKGVVESMRTTDERFRNRFEDHQKDIEEKLDEIGERIAKVEKKVNYIYAWSAGAAAAVVFVAEILRRIWSNIGN